MTTLKFWLADDCDAPPCELVTKLADWFSDYDMELLD